MIMHLRVFDPPVGNADAQVGGKPNENFLSGLDNPNNCKELPPVVAVFNSKNTGGPEVFNGGRASGIPFLAAKR